MLAFKLWLIFGTLPDTSDGTLIVCPQALADTPRFRGEQCPISTWEWAVHSALAAAVVITEPGEPPPRLELRAGVGPVLPIWGYGTAVVRLEMARLCAEAICGLPPAAAVPLCSSVLEWAAGPGSAPELIATLFATVAPSRVCGDELAERLSAALVSVAGSICSVPDRFAVIRAAAEAISKPTTLPSPPAAGPRMTVSDRRFRSALKPADAVFLSSVEATMLKPISKITSCLTSRDAADVTELLTGLARDNPVNPVTRQYKALYVEPAVLTAAGRRRIAETAAGLFVSVWAITFGWSDTSKEPGLVDSGVWHRLHKSISWLHTELSPLVSVAASLKPGGSGAVAAFVNGTRKYLSRYNGAHPYRYPAQPTVPVQAWGIDAKAIHRLSASATGGGGSDTDPIKMAHAARGVPGKAGIDRVLLTESLEALIVVNAESERRQIARALLDDYAAASDAAQSVLRDRALSLGVKDLLATACGAGPQLPLAFERLITPLSAAALDSEAEIIRGFNRLSGSDRAEAIDTLARLALLAPWRTMAQVIQDADESPTLHVPLAAALKALREWSTLRLRTQGPTLLVSVIAAAVSGTGQSRLDLPTADHYLSSFLRVLLQNCCTADNDGVRPSKGVELTALDLRVLHESWLIRWCVLPYLSADPKYGDTHSVSLAIDILTVCIHGDRSSSWVSKPGLLITTLHALCALIEHDDIPGVVVSRVHVSIAKIEAIVLAVPLDPMIANGLEWLSDQFSWLTILHFRVLMIATGIATPISPLVLSACSLGNVSSWKTATTCATDATTANTVAAELQMVFIASRVSDHVADELIPRLYRGATDDECNVPNIVQSTGESESSSAGYYTPEVFVPVLVSVLLTSTADQTDRLFRKVVLPLLDRAGPTIQPLMLTLHQSTEGAAAIVGQTWHQDSRLIKIMTRVVLCLVHSLSRGGTTAIAETETDYQPEGAVGATILDGQVTKTRLGGAIAKICQSYSVIAEATFVAIADGRAGNDWGNRELTAAADLLLQVCATAGSVGLLAATAETSTRGTALMLAAKQLVIVAINIVKRCLGAGGDRTGSGSTEMKSRYLHALLDAVILLPDGDERQASIAEIDRAASQWLK